MDRGGKRSKFRASVAMPCRNKLDRVLDGQVRPHRLAGDGRLRQRIGRSAVALALGTKQDADDGELTLDGLDERRRLAQLLLPSRRFQLLTQLGQQGRTHVAAAAFETVCGTAQRLGRSA